MEKKQYVAYVSSYTQGDRHGIRVYNVDMENGRFEEKEKVEITNSSYLTVSHNGKYLYSITDFGVEAFRILQDGSLELINHASINGMRGCYLFPDYTDKYLLVAGYHDGKLTVLRLEEGGSVGQITDEVFHKSMGSALESNSRPHITCARMTPDNRCLLVSDQGMDHVKVYRLDMERGKVQLLDIIRSELSSNPRHIKISGDGKYIYVLHEQSCKIEVYRYEYSGEMPTFEKIQSLPIIEKKNGSFNCASAFSFSDDKCYLLASAVGSNSVTVMNVDQESGLLTKNFNLPVSGDYPKDADFFPGREFLVSLNHESNTITFFRVDLEAGTMVMNGAPMKVSMPNCILFHRIR